MSAVEPVAKRVKVCNVTAELLGLFKFPCTAVTPEDPDITLKLPLDPELKATTAEVGVELGVEVKVMVGVKVVVGGGVAVQV